VVVYVTIARGADAAGLRSDLLALAEPLKPRTTQGDAAGSSGASKGAVTEVRAESLGFLASAAWTVFPGDPAATTALGRSGGVIAAIGPGTGAGPPRARVGRRRADGGR